MIIVTITNITKPTKEHISIGIHSSLHPLPPLLPLALRRFLISKLLEKTKLLLKLKRFFSSGKKYDS